MPSRLDALRARLGAATPGPWQLHEFDPEGGYDTLGGGHTLTAVAHCEAGDCRAHLPEAMPYDHCPPLVIVDQCNYGDNPGDDSHTLNPRAAADAALIAHAPADLAALLAVADAAEEYRNRSLPLAGQEHFGHALDTALAALTTEEE